MKGRSKARCYLSVALIAAMVLGFSGCGGSSGGDGEKTIKANLVMGTGGVSGVWYPVGGAICAAMSNDAGLNVTVQASGGGVENVRTVASGERDLGMVTNNVALYAYEGKENFDGEPLDNVRGICAFAPVQAQFLVRANSGIACIKDFKGKAVGVGAIGSGDEASAREFLTALDMSYDDIDEKMLSYTEQSTAFKDRHLDVMFTLASAPTSGILDAASQAEVAMVPVGGEEQAAIIAKYPYYTPATITSEQYPFIDGGSDTVSLTTLLLTNAEADEDVVYEITKNMFEQIDSLQSAHGSMKEFSLETALDGMSVPLHPGAERYYKEQGIL